MMASPRVVALGGGHGTAVTLRAVRQYSSHVTAIVSVADDGGSSGRFRELLDVVALGDMRKCLVALAEPQSVLATAFEHRFEEEELAGHALGNLILAGLVEATGDLVSGVAAAADLLGAAGVVLPATRERVVLKAEAGRGEVAGQVAVSQADRIRRVSLVPGDAGSPPEAVIALAGADQIVIGPGSLYTSILAAAGRTRASPRPSARPKARGFTSAISIRRCPRPRAMTWLTTWMALAAHGIEVDVVLCDSSNGMACGPVTSTLIDRPLAGSNGLVHDPAKLAQALSDLLA